MNDNEKPKKNFSIGRVAAVIAAVLVIVAAAFIAFIYGALSSGFSCGAEGCNILERNKHIFYPIITIFISTTGMYFIFKESKFLK